MSQSPETTGPADAFSRQVLEFPALVDLLHGYLSGPISEPRLARLAPRAEIEDIQPELERAKEAVEYLRESPRPSLGTLKNPRSLLDQLAVEGVSLSALEILAVLEVARAACDLRAIFLKTPFVRLNELAAELADFRDLVARLWGKILPDGSVDSSASPALARIRKEIDRLRAELQATLERLVRRMSKDQVLQDAVVTIRNERFVIPIRAEEKRRVPGVVHGASSSGATVYLEPLETVPLNNELVELQDREFAEIQRILAEFSARLRARGGELQAATEILSELDLAFAKAEFARHYDCCLPEFVPERQLVLKEARHPLLENALAAQKRKSVPLTVELSAPRTLMVISGPNTGGKTVALKTLGMAVLMAQAGLPVAASEAHLPLFGRVLADIGDQQSIEANLSTFSAHVTNIQSMAQVAGRDDLVLLDELGASTDPNEGAALGVAILEHFRARASMTFVTTHHSRLKAYAAETSEALNAAMEFDEVHLRPTYRLLIGLPGKSSALDIAERLGLESSIVEKARGLLHPADAEAATLLARLHEQKAEFERLTARLDEQRREMDARREELERKFEQERRARLRELDTRLEETLRQYEKRWEQSVAEIRAQAENLRLARQAERKAAALKQEAREEWNAQVLETLGAPEAAEEVVVDAPPAVGNRVRLESFSTPGTVTALLEGGQVEVEVGRLRMRVRREELRVLAPAQGKSQAHLRAPRAAEFKPLAKAAPSDERRGAAEAPAEINVIGNTAEEARERVDKFLDESFLEGRFRLRVVHGHGKGILRKSLHEMFASHPHVEKFYLAPPHEGSAGATIVELKL
jgi:DNA mismatch repair protein MutS2